MMVKKKRKKNIGTINTKTSKENKITINAYTGTSTHNTLASTHKHTQTHKHTNTLASTHKHTNTLASRANVQMNAAI